MAEKRIFFFIVSAGTDRRVVKHGNPWDSGVIIVSNDVTTIAGADYYVQLDDLDVDPADRNSEVAARVIGVIFDFFYENGIGKERWQEMMDRMSTIDAGGNKVITRTSIIDTLSALQK